METTKEEIKYPENLILKEQLKNSGMSVTFVADKIGVSRVYLSNVINGNDKGGQIKDALTKLLA